MALYAAEADDTYEQTNPDYPIYSSQEAFTTFSVGDETRDRTINRYNASSLVERAMAAYDGDDLTMSWLGLLTLDGIHQQVEVRMPYRIEIAGLDEGIPRDNNGIVYTCVSPTIF